MSNAADVIVPHGATHVHWFYGDPHYYKKEVIDHLNQVSEEWDKIAQYNVWNFKTNLWEGVGSGFSPRKLKELK